VAQEEIGSLIAAQRKHFLAGNTRPFDVRKDALQRLENTIVSHRDDLLDALAADLGRVDKLFLAD